MKVIIKKCGKNAQLRIPLEIMNAASIKFNDTVDIYVKDGNIIITPVQEYKYEISELFSGITPENRHSELNFGPAIGMEKTPNKSKWRNFFINTSCVSDDFLM